jgi:hypothetical protein
MKRKDWMPYYVRATWGDSNQIHPSRIHTGGRIGQGMTTLPIDARTPSTARKLQHAMAVLNELAGTELWP